LLIERILARKGSDVAWVPPTASVTEVLATLRERNVGAVVVSDDEGQTAAGICSERDVVRRLAADGAGTLELPVAEVMTSPVVTCEPNATVEQTMALMTERRFRHVPVVHGGRLAGIVSIGDVVLSRVQELSDEAKTLHDYITTGR
jgi:CBS domain-containing protein